MLKELGVGEWNSDFAAAPNSRYFGALCAVIADVYNTEKVCSCCHSIDISCILLHVKFEDGLSVQILRNRPKK
jgi:hypothetical protein